MSDPRPSTWSRVLLKGSMGLALAGLVDRVSPVHSTCTGSKDPSGTVIVSLRSAWQRGEATNGMRLLFGWVAFLSLRLGG